jgi:hypothetical protein
MKKFNFVSLSMVTIMALVGCGGGSDASTPKIATGYYVDAAVSGLTYTCGSQTGTTDVEGKFSFEVGQSCLFKVGDIELPIVEASELKDGAKFVEDDAKTTQFLQSLDNAKDGKITITPELIAALKTKDIVIVPDDTGLKELIKAIETFAKDNSDFTFTGYYVTAEEAAIHVVDSKEDVAGEIEAKGMAFTLPSKFYTDIEKKNYGYTEFKADILEFTVDNKFTYTDMVFRNGVFVPENYDYYDNNYDSNRYIFENGKWIEDKEEENSTIVLSKNDTIITLNNYELSFKSIKNLEGKLIEIEGSDLSLTMPKGAKEIEIGLKNATERYVIFQPTTAPYGTGNLIIDDDFNSLSGVVKTKCGKDYFHYVYEDNSAIKGIAFTCGQEGQTSGTLVAVKDDNTLVSTGIGTWEIKTLGSSDIKALLITMDVKYNSEYRDFPLYAMKDGEVWEGYYESPDMEIRPLITYNQIAFDAFTEKIVATVSASKDLQNSSETMASASSKGDVKASLRSFTRSLRN